MKNEFALKKAKPHHGRGKPRRNWRESPDIKERLHVLEKRCADLGWKPSEANIKRAKAEHLGFNYGIALEIDGYNSEDWECMKEIHTVLLRWFRSIGNSPSAKSGHPQIIPTKAEISLHEPVQPSLTPEQIDARDEAAVEAMKRIDKQLLEYIPDQAAHVKGVLVYGERITDAFLPAIRSFREQRGRK